MCAEQLTVRSALKEAIARLSAANVPSHLLAAELLLMQALGHDRAWLYGHPEELLEATAARQFFDLIERRATGVPTQYLTGHQEFWGLDFEVTSDVLIPRPETEHVIEVTLEALGSRSKASAVKIADVGTGSGCIVVALAKELPAAHLFASDISAAALAVARRNAQRHGVADRIQFIHCNLLTAFKNVPQFDAIVSNPPYVARIEESQLAREVREHEPSAALFGGPTGSELYSSLIAEAEGKLKPKGFLIAELGYNSLEPVRKIFDSRLDWSNFGVTNDLAGIPRVFCAQR